jgi:hypothetical protein
MPPQTSNSRTAAARTKGGPATIEPPDVHLDALKAEAPKPGDSDRNLFRFKPKLPPPPPPPSAEMLRLAPTPGPPPPPAVPPIALKFIGIVESPQRALRVAVLSDERGVYHGREGDIIEGRYRILKIGVESIELAYVDGRGRSTIRLSGS